MVDRNRRFFLRVPVGYDEMSEADQHGAVMAMWREAMVQLGGDADRLMTARVAQDENSDDALRDCDRTAPGDRTGVALVHARAVAAPPVRGREEAVNSHRSWPLLRSALPTSPVIFT